MRNLYLKATFGTPSVNLVYLFYAQNRQAYIILYFTRDMGMSQDELTCVCVRPIDAANSARSGSAKYCVFWNRRCRAASWKLE